MNRQRTPGVGRIAAKYGLILGVLTFAAFLAVTHGSAARQSRLATLATAVLTIVLMVLAHREWKQSHDGLMSYSRGLGSGTLLTSVAALVRCVLVFLYVKLIDTRFLAAALQAQRAALAQRGISGARAQHALAITAPLMTPVGIAVLSLITAVIGGFIVALIVSIFTQKGDPASYDTRPPG